MVLQGGAALGRGGVQLSAVMRVVAVRSGARPWLRLRIDDVHLCVPKRVQHRGRRIEMCHGGPVRVSDDALGES